MRRVMLAAVAAVGVAASVQAVAGFDEGVAAFEGENYEKALAELLPLAQEGRVEAMSYLARTYDEGLGDSAKALPWYEKAAAKGDPSAQTRLADMYDQGEGVPQDTDKALELYDKAAAQGDDEAQVALGVHYRDELNDNVSAQRYFTQAADEGNANGQYQLALLLLGEPGVPADVPRAWMYLSLAADDIDDAAQTRDVLELRMKAVDTAQGKKLLDAWKLAHE